MFSLAWKEITRRRNRALLSTVGLLLVALLTSAGLVLGRAIRRATTEPLKVAGADLVVAKRTVPCAFAPVKLPKDLTSISMKDVARIRGLDGVRSASGSLVVWAFEDGKPTVVAGVIPGSVRSGPLRQYRQGARCCVLEEGRLFEPNESNVAILDRTFAEQRGVTVGDEVTLGPRTFEVIGILKVAGVAVISGGQAYIPLATAQAMLGKGAVVVYVFVTTQQGADLSRLEREIRGIVGEGCQVSTQESLPVQVSQSAALASGGTGVFVALILAVGGLLVVRSALATVRERVVEIGILRAVGWRKRHIVSLLGAEMLLQGVVGAVAGIVLGHAAAFGACVQLNLQLPASFNSYPPCATTAPPSQLTLAPQVEFSAILMVFVLTAALAVGAGLIAGLRAAGQSPAESLRQA